MPNPNMIVEHLNKIFLNDGSINMVQLGFLKESVEKKILNEKKEIDFSFKTTSNNHELNQALETISFIVSYYNQFTHNNELQAYETFLNQIAAVIPGENRDKKIILIPTNNGQEFLFIDQQKYNILAHKRQELSTLFDKYSTNIEILKSLTLDKLLILMKYTAQNIFSDFDLLSAISKFDNQIIDKIFNIGITPITIQQCNNLTLVQLIESENKAPGFCNLFTDRNFHFIYNYYQRNNSLDKLINIKRTAPALLENITNHITNRLMESNLHYAYIEAAINNSDFLEIIKNEHLVYHIITHNLSPNELWQIKLTDDELFDKMQKNYLTEQDSNLYEDIARFKNTNIICKFLLSIIYQITNFFSDIATNFYNAFFNREAMHEENGNKTLGNIYMVNTPPTEKVPSSSVTLGRSNSNEGQNRG